MPKESEMNTVLTTARVCFDFGQETALILTARVISVHIAGAIQRVPILLQHRVKAQTFGYGFNSPSDLSRALEQYSSRRVTNPG